MRLAPNVALKGTATQISDNGGHPASLVIDGNFESSCSLTKYEVAPWWQVDLLEVYMITKVAINSGSSNRGTSSLDLEFFKYHQRHVNSLFWVC